MAEASTSAATLADPEQPRIVGADGLTNKERRKAKQAEKRKRAGDGEVEDNSKSKSEAAAADGINAEKGEDRKEEDAANEELEAEVEALSHKEKRKRRKLEKQGKAVNGSTASDAAAAEHTVSAKGRESQPERSPYSVWIGNLSFNTSPDRLQNWLEEKGVQGISRMHMPKGIKKFEYNKGFCYVDLPSHEAVQAAIALSEDHLDGRRLLIKSGSDFKGRPAIDPSLAALAGSNAVHEPNGSGVGPGDEAGAVMAATGGKTGLTKTAQKILRTQKNPPGPTLFLGNLSFNSTQDGVQELFEASAKARDAWKRPDKRQKKKAAKKAKAAKRSDEKGEEASSDDSSDSSDDSSDSSSDSDDDSEEEEAEEKAKEAGVRGACIRKVRMGTFEDTGKCKGFAFIDFHSPAHATASLVDPRNYRLDGRELKIEFAGADAVRRGAPKGQVSKDGTAAGGGRGQWPTPRASLSTLPQAGRSRRPAPEWRVQKGHARQRLEATNIKETSAERRERKAQESTKQYLQRRAKPGAALANAQRGKTGIDTSGEAGKRTTFD